MKLRDKRRMKERTGGRNVPADSAGKAEAVMKAVMIKERASRIELLRQAAELYGRLRDRSQTAVDDPANRETLDAILQLYKGVANTKLSFPKVTPPPFFEFSGTWLPEFDFAYPEIPQPYGNPTESYTALKNGQISASVETSESPLPAQISSGTVFAAVGCNFPPPQMLPLPMPGILTISASPTYSFEWVTNSLNSAAFVYVDGSITLQICEQNDAGASVAYAQDFQQIFLEATPGQLQFDFQFDIQKSLSTSMNVNPGVTYCCQVIVEAAAAGLGWPPSLATAMVSATVPSISYKFVGDIVRAPDNQ
jgi:hypothetical protein